MDKIKKCEDCEYFWQDFQSGLNETTFPFSDNCGKLKGDQSMGRDGPNVIWEDCPLDNQNNKGGVSYVKKKIR